jgi:hypothetical protein
MVCATPLAPTAKRQKSKMDTNGVRFIVSDQSFPGGRLFGLFSGTFGQAVKTKGILTRISHQHRREGAQIA